MLAFIEFFYRADGADYGFDPEFADLSLASRCRLQLKNTNHLLNLAACDWGVSPTEFQRSTVPAEYQGKISVVHDGIDTDYVRSDPNASVALQKAGVKLTRQDEVITFVNRNMEPYRGFHIFMRALPEIQRRRPNAWVLIIGGDEVSYGAPPPEGKTYRQMMLAEVGSQLDMNRIRFLGRLAYPDFLRVLQTSAAHIYLTYPFVLSWSMLEAMATECLVIGSATAPVQEVIRHGENGLLVDFFSTQHLVDAIESVLDHPDRMEAVRQRARRTVVERYDLKSLCLPRHLALVDTLAAGRLPASDSPPAPSQALRRVLAAKQARRQGRPQARR
jgi:glycosyltransferase involved in cell wall biosynthesis